MSTIAIAAPQFTRTSPTRAAVRLTRRGKVVIVALAFVAIALLTLAFGPSVVATDEAGLPQQVRTVKIMAGETLWEIAAEANPAGDIRDTVDAIVRLNSLPNASAVQAGSVIAVPVY